MISIINRYIIIFCALILINGSCLSQSSPIYGYVTDKQNDSEISRAKVKLFIPDGKTFETITNSIGHFSFDDLFNNLDSVALLLVEADNYLNEKYKLQIDDLIKNNRVDIQMTSAISKSYLPILLFGANSSLIDSNDFQKIDFMTNILIDNNHIDIDLISLYDSRLESKNVSMDRALRVTNKIAINSSLSSRIYITHVCDTISEIRFSIR